MTSVNLGIPVAPPPALAQRRPTRRLNVGGVPVGGGAPVSVATATLQPDDVVLVAPGSRIPADGEVVSGSSSVNQAAVTGESMPAPKEAGSRVFAGTVNGSGALEVRVNGAAGESALARIVDTVTKARANRAPTQRFTDSFQRVFTPLVLTVTVLLVVVPPLFGQPFGESFRRAMVLLVAASPCALALSTPSAILAGIARAARSGIVFKGGAQLETAATVRAIAFDKTGTITLGLPVLTDIVPHGTDADTLLRLAAAAESRSKHPLALALQQEAKARQLALPLPAELVSLDGRGISARVDGRQVLIGNRRLLDEQGIGLPENLRSQSARLESEGHTLAFVTADSQPLGVLAFRDEPRPEAAGTIGRLRDQGTYGLTILTGDNAAVAGSIAAAVGISDVRADLLPADKLSALEDLQRQHGRVAMIGDGVNDAPALVRADLGIAMGGAGTDLAMETAGVVLMADGLGQLPLVFELSRATRAMIVQNLVISLGVIALLVPSALFGWASIGVAIVLHEFSTLVVVANALRLLGFRGSRPLQ